MAVVTYCYDTFVVSWEAFGLFSPRFFLVAGIIFIRPSFFSDSFEFSLEYSLIANFLESLDWVSYRYRYETILSGRFTVLPSLIAPMLRLAELLFRMAFDTE